MDRFFVFFVLFEEGIMSCSLYCSRLVIGLVVDFELVGGGEVIFFFERCCKWGNFVLGILGE